MHRFEEIGLVCRIIDEHGNTNWKLNSDAPCEFYVTCRQTGDVAALDHASSVSLRNLIKKIEDRLRERGYSKLQLNVSFYGSRSAERRN